MTVFLCRLKSFLTENNEVSLDTSIHSINSNLTTFFIILCEHNSES